MNEEFIVFKRNAKGDVVYLDQRHNVTTALLFAKRFPYWSDAQIVANKYAMRVREL